MDRSITSYLDPSPFLPQGKSLTGRWVNSHELLAGDVIIGRNGERLVIDRISQRFESSFPVSNLTIGEYHNYSVGANSILVHNESICDVQAAAAAALQDMLDTGVASYDEVARLLSQFKNADDVFAKLAPSNVARTVDTWLLRHQDITARLKQHLSQAVKQAKLTPAQARDVMKNGRASTHWGTQIDTRFKELVQNDPILRGEVAVSERGVAAPDVIDLQSKRWWDVTTVAEEFAKKPAKYGTQFGEGTPLLYAEP